MVSGCIVLYNSDIDKLLVTCNSFLSSSIVSKLFIIDLGEFSHFVFFPIPDDRIQYIHINKNIGFGAAHNLGINYSIGCGIEFHIILNPDLIISDGCIESLYSYILTDSKIGLIQPKIFNEFNIVQDSCRLLPTPFNLFIRLFPFSFYFNYKYELKGFKHDRVVNIPYLSGCFMFIRNAIIDEVGFFDENFFLYAEDIDFSRRIHSKFRTIYYPFASIVHYHNKLSFKKTKFLIIHVISIIRYFNKWGWVFDTERSFFNKNVLKEICN